VLINRSEMAEARKLATASAAIAARMGQTWHRGQAHLLLAFFHNVDGNGEAADRQAATALTHFHDGVRQALGDQAPAARMAGNRVVDLYREWGKPEAAELYAKGLRD
jgi:hypothetical protein